MSLNKKCKHPSLVVANSYRLELDETTMLELGKCHRKFEGKWHHFWFAVFDMEWHEGLWVGIYKGVEVQDVKIVN